VSSVALAVRSKTTAGLVLIMLVGAVFVGRSLLFGFTAQSFLAIILSMIALGIFAIRPLWGVFVLILLSTNLLQFVHPNYLPSLQITSSLRFNLFDILLLAFSVLALARLRARKEWPPLGTGVASLLAVFFLVFGISLLTGLTNLGEGLPQLRSLFAYVTFFVLVSAVDTPAKLKDLVRFVLVLMFVSVALQVWEYSSGYRLTSGLSLSRYFDENVYLPIQGASVLYTWNRATLILYVGLMISLATFTQGDFGSKWSGLATVVGLLGFALALVRQWYVYLAVGFIVLLALGAVRSARSWLRLGLSVGGLVLVIVWITPMLASMGGITPLTAFATRIGEIFELQNQPSYYGRVAIIQLQWKAFLSSSLLLGYGFGPQVIISNDTGIINALVQMGILGTGAILYLVGFSLLQGFKALTMWKPGSPLQRGYLLGAIAALVGLLSAFLTAWNVFSWMQEGIVAACVVLGIIDRSYQFSMNHHVVSVGGRTHSFEQLREQ